MKKTTLLSLCLTMASTSLAFGAATYQVKVSNQSPAVIEAIETYIDDTSPWADIVSGMRPGAQQLITINRRTNRFPYIQFNGKIYKLTLPAQQPVKLMRGDSISLLNYDGELGAMFVSNNKHIPLDVVPVFNGNYLEHINSLPSTVVPIPQTSIEQYAKALASSKVQ